MALSFSWNFTIGSKGCMQAEIVAMCAAIVAVGAVASPVWDAAAAVQKYYYFSFYSENFKIPCSTRSIAETLQFSPPFEKSVPIT